MSHCSILDRSPAAYDQLYEMFGGGEQSPIPSRSALERLDVDPNDDIGGGSLAVSEIIKARQVQSCKATVATYCVA
jgi:hypothetical protein